MGLETVLALVALVMVLGQLLVLGIQQQEDREEQGQ
jgi:hypothetical protein